MFSTPFAFMAQTSGGVDPDAQAFFDRVTTAGGSLTSTEESAVNQLVLDLKSNSLWSPMKVIYPFVGSSNAACRQNLKSSSYTGTFNGGISFASTGFQGNGANGYLDTNVNTFADANFLLNSSHVSIYSRTTGAPNTQTDFGIVTNAGIYFSFYINYLSNIYARINAIPGVDNAPNTTTQGFFLGSRTAASSIFIKRNTTTLLNGTDTATNKPDGELYLGALNSIGAGGAVLHTVKEYAFFTLGDGISDAQGDTLYSVVQAFQTTLGRQV